MTDRSNRLQTGNSVWAIGRVQTEFLFANAVRNEEGLTEPFEIRNGVEIPVGTYRGNQFLVQHAEPQLEAVVGGGLLTGAVLRWHDRCPERLGERQDPPAAHDGSGLLAQCGRRPGAGGVFTTNLLVAKATYASPRAFVSVPCSATMMRGRRGRRWCSGIRTSPEPICSWYDDTRNILGETPPVQARKFIVKMTFYVVPRGRPSTRPATGPARAA